MKTVKPHWNVRSDAIYQSAWSAFNWKKKHTQKRAPKWRSFRHFRFATEYTRNSRMPQNSIWKSIVHLLTCCVCVICFFFYFFFSFLYLLWLYARRTHWRNGNVPKKTQSGKNLYRIIVKSMPCIIYRWFYFYFSLFISFFYCAFICKIQKGFSFVYLNKSIHESLEPTEWKPKNLH